METTFENAKVGDRVWSFGYGWGTIQQINTNKYPLLICFDNYQSEALEKVVCYTKKGTEFLDNSNPTLFWDEIKFTIPTRPKRKVKKEGWINIYKIGELPSIASVIYSTEEIAISNKIENNSLTAKIEWEEEE